MMSKEPVIKHRQQNYGYILVSSLLACLILYGIEQIIKVEYLSKTLTKVALFTGIPFSYIKLYKQSSLKSAFHFKTHKRPGLKIGFGLGMMSFLVVVVTYVLLKDVINIEEISRDLKSRAITPSNFVFVACYITFVNSFLEEFFFRGFIFLNLYEMKLKKLAYVYSSLLFALYHMAIFKSWFNLGLTAVALTGLMVIGFIFNFIDTKSKNFINSWIVHILADAGIMLIGMKVLGIFR